MLRLVLDTQVWLDWLVFGDPGIAPIREACTAGRLEIVADAACRTELGRVLAYDFGRHSLDSAAREACFAAFEKIVHFFETNGTATLPLPRCADPDDQKFLELAAAARADMLVTKDNALLALAGRAPFRIVRPAVLIEFLADAARH